LRKLKKEKYIIFVTAQNFATMRKNTRPNPRTTESYSAEINMDNYSYYRFIPVANIEEKQRKIIDRYRTVQEVNEPHTYLATMHQYEESKNLPILDLIPTEKPNTYEVDLRNLEDKLQKTQDELYSNSYMITQQEEHIEENKKTLEQQAHQMQSNNAIIQNNGTYIQQQIHCYTHNTNIISQQCTMVHQQNTDIVSKQEQISSLQEQVTGIEEQLSNLQQQVESYQSQLNYHASMVNAFNALLQNPHYFSQLIMMTMSQQMPPPE